MTRSGTKASFAGPAAKVGFRLKRTINAHLRIDRGTTQDSDVRRTAVYLSA